MWLFLPEETVDVNEVVNGIFLADKKFLHGCRIKRIQAILKIPRRADTLPPFIPPLFHCISVILLHFFGKFIMRPPFRGRWAPKILQGHFIPG